MKNPIVKAVSTVSNVGKSVASSIMKLNNTLFGSTEVRNSSATHREWTYRFSFLAGGG